MPGAHRKSGRSIRHWLDLFLACLPDFMRRHQPPYRLELDEHRGRVTRNGRQLAEIRREGGGLDPSVVALLKPHEYPLVLVVPAAWTLSRNVALPAAALENLRQVLEYELDRLTPFTADQVYLDYRITSEPEEGGTVGTELVVVPRARVDAWLDLLRGAGIQIDGIGVQGGGDEMNLLPPERRPRPQIARLIWRSLPAVLVLVLFVSSLALPLWQKRKIAMELQSREAALRSKANQVMSLRQQLEAKTGELEKVQEQWQSAPPVLDILLLLTSLLPDHTYLQQMTIKDDELVIRGLSGQASALIGLLEESPVFEEPHFLSPVTQQRGKELFHLAATIRRPAAGEVLEMAAATQKAEEKKAEEKKERGKPSAPVSARETKTAGESDAGEKKTLRKPAVSSAEPPGKAVLPDVRQRSPQPAHEPVPEPVVQRILSGGG